MLLNKEELLKAKPLKYIDVDCPELGGTIRLRAMTCSIRDEYEQIMVMHQAKHQGAKVPLPHLRALFLVYHIVDEDGKQILTVDDVEELGEQSSKDLDNLFSIAQGLSSLTDEDVEELKKK